MLTTQSYSTGKLYAVGVGPGASDLMTLRAANLLRTADVIAVPEKTQGLKDSFAWAIATGAVPEEQIEGQKLFLHFPMSRDIDVTVPAWQRAALQIAERLRQGLDVVFITEGDPSVFSTWAYLQEELEQLLPELEVEIVPGVSSITAVPAATQVPLADGQERFCVVPATYGIEMLPRLVEEFDTIILIKAGRMVEALIEQLEPMGLLECARYVSHASGDNQEVYEDLRQVPKEHRYFAMVQLSIRGRKGRLRHGKAA
ncbi:precorrin-2 C(20)-methyltransferase [Ferrimonas aestuarii]|uniref:Precorrin-2 C(20)-methyltransferase n=1 Tax=Ferrimonas aestuarii TaxID=2569539 RepID=A0A4U1BGF7_9GAMM|nr:precorrin-2 C(20)-methyltransferase [Ferrimonas aestuarii]TKB50055.1 precorrin-2 C(20)-methyltransferase [Ferrimonas aestuarii]